VNDSDNQLALQRFEKPQELRLQYQSYKVLAQAMTKLTKPMWLDMQDSDDVENDEHRDEVAERLK